MSLTKKKILFLITRINNTLININYYKFITQLSDIQKELNNYKNELNQMIK
jgi:hypothetical protein